MLEGDQYGAEIPPKSDASFHEIELNLEQIKFFKRIKILFSDWLLDFKRNLKGSDYLIARHHALGQLHKTIA